MGNDTEADRGQHGILILATDPEKRAVIPEADQLFQ